MEIQPEVYPISEPFAGLSKKIICKNYSLQIVRKALKFSRHFGLPPVTP
jgi:hypothetical protein